MSRKGRARAASATTTRGWARSEPKRKSDRRALKARCGTRAFLMPDKLKFPVMAKGSTSCQVDCRALRVAKQRASMTHRPSVMKKADRLARRAGCRWAP